MKPKLGVNHLKLKQDVNLKAFFIGEFLFYLSKFRKRNYLTIKMTSHCMILTYKFCEAFSAVC